jgi:hypothetical protein
MIVALLNPGESPVIAGSLGSPKIKNLQGLIPELRLTFTTKRHSGNLWGLWCLLRTARVLFRMPVHLGFAANKLAEPPLFNRERESTREYLAVLMRSVYSQP